MTPSAFEALVAIITPLLIPSAILEYILSGTWNRIYFRSGLRIFKQTFQAASPLPKPSAQMIEKSLIGKLPRRMLFKEFNPSQYAFRYTFLHLGPSSTPIMHGVLEFSDHAQTLTVNGYANWVLIPLSLFICLMVFIVPSAITAIIFFCVIAYFVWLYQSDAKAFNLVGEMARDIWQGNITQPTA